MSGEGVVAASAAAGAQGRPFGYVTPEGKTAMVCEQDLVIQEQISGALKKMGYLTSQPTSFRDALKQMRFHVFDIIFIGEDFTNNVLVFLENMNMRIRRKSFVVLISSKISTMDNMEAFHKSVNLIVNKRDIREVERILRQAVAEHEDFYRTFKEKFPK